MKSDRYKSPPSDIYIVELFHGCNSGRVTLLNHDADIQVGYLDVVKSSVHTDIRQVIKKEMDIE
jgi:hypothetical protein